MNSLQVKLLTLVHNVIFSDGRNSSYWMCSLPDFQRLRYRKSSGGRNLSIMDVQTCQEICQSQSQCLSFDYHRKTSHCLINKDEIQTLSYDFDVDHYARILKTCSGLIFDYI